ncbi:MAG: hypothetical protein ACM65L_14385 [Microcoleus sp.]
MTPAILKSVTFDEFIDWHPENSENRYENNLLFWFTIWLMANIIPVCFGETIGFYRRHFPKLI